MENLPKIALSIRQPWASAIIHGGKDFENRSTFSLRHMIFDKLDGSWLAIHAAIGMTQDEYLDGAEFCKLNGYQVPRPDQLIFGAIIGKARVLKSGSFKVACSPWMNGATGILLADPTPLAEPIYATGRLGLFEWKADSEKRSVKPWMEKYGRESLPKPYTKSEFSDLFEGGA
jgi:hypothetical protein